MSEPVVTESVPTATRARRSAVLVLGAVGVAVVAGAAVLYSQRGPIGTRLAVDYLNKQGVPAEIRIDRLSPNGFTGSVRLGPAGDPDLTIERLEVDFEPFPLARDGLTPRVRSVRMVRPRLKARYANGRMTFGSLQKLVDDFLSRPAVGPPPDVVIEDGAARIATEAGEVRVAAAGAFLDGRVQRLDAQMGAHRLARGAARFEIDSASIQLRGANERLTGRFAVAAPRLVQEGTSIERLKATGALDLPYRTGARPFEGRVGLEAAVETASLRVGDTTVADGKGVIVLGGASRGGLDTLTLDGRGSLAFDARRVDGAAGGRDLRGSVTSDTLHLARTRRGISFAGPMTVAGSAAALRFGDATVSQMRLNGAASAAEGNLDTTGVRLVATPRLSLSAGAVGLGDSAVRGLRVQLASPELTLASVGEGPRVSGAFDTRIDAAALKAGGATLSNLTLAGKGTAETTRGAVNVAWRGSARSGAGASAAEARALATRLSPIAADPDALARLFQTLRLDAPDLRIETSGASGAVSLGRPARLAGEGGAFVLSPVGGAVLAEFGPDGLRGALTLTGRGAALPEIDLDLPAYRLSSSGLIANARLRIAELNAGPLQDVSLDAAGRLAPGEGGTAFFAADCIELRAARMVGEEGPVATDLSGRACPADGRPLASFGPGGWTAHAAIRDAGARAPAAQIDVREANGLIDVRGDAEGLAGGMLRLSSVAVVDRAAEPRFLSLTASGEASLQSRRTMVGTFTLAEAAGARAIGTVGVTHDIGTGVGRARIEAREIAFSPSGLQPAQIAPIAARVLTEADGAVSFTGDADWGPDGLTSRGRVSTSGLNFRASMGQVRGLKGAVEFTSLAPPVTAPEQSVTIERIDWIVPLEQASLTLTLTPTEMRIVKAQVGMGGGTVVLDPLDLKLGAVLPTSGTLRLSDVDLGRLVSQFNLADKLTIQAKVDGVLPFAFTSEGLRFTDGRIFADGPGRLSIKREALTGVAASDASTATQPNAMQSFAYQAMENLAFEQMDARITSQPQGRLGVLFHINGRHDPAVGLTPRVGVLDLLRGRAFEQDLPLPKGTPVDLTLDTSLNFDELMAAYSNAGRSSPVQP